METIKHFEKISIKDDIKYSPIKGLVRIFKNGILDTSHSKDGWLTNMTIAIGREFVAQAIFKKSSPQSMFGDISNYKIDSFGIGSGGSIIHPGDKVTFNGPSLCDIGLYKPIKLNSQCLDAIDNDGNLVQNVVKKVESVGPANIPGSIEFETSLSSEFTICPQSYYTVVKVVCIIDNNEPSFLNPGEFVRMDEAMLYMTSPTGTNPIPFAHICFPPKFVELESGFKIEWYVIC